jgi:guanine nucleotide exchange factor VAV
VHSGFHADLVKAMTVSRDGSTAGATTISDCFITWKERLLIYGDFCSNLPHAQELIDKLCETRPIISEQVSVCDI